MKTCIGCQWPESETDDGFDENGYCGREVCVHASELRTALAEARERIAELEKRQCEHGWKGVTPEDGARIADRCPACKTKSLFLGTGGWITCGNLGCRRLTLEDWLKDAALSGREG